MRIWRLDMKDGNGPASEDFSEAQFTSPSEAVDTYARHHGVDPVDVRVTEVSSALDADALDEIQGILDGQEWLIDDLDRIAEIVRKTGRPVRDTSELEPWEEHRR